LYSLKPYKYGSLYCRQPSNKEAQCSPLYVSAFSLPLSLLRKIYCLFSIISTIFSLVFHPIVFSFMVSELQANASVRSNSPVNFFVSSYLCCFFYLYVSLDSKLSCVIFFFIFCSIIFPAFSHFCHFYPKPFIVFFLFFTITIFFLYFLMLLLFIHCFVYDFTMFSF
jgi:hypothetical protein